MKYYFVRTETTIGEHSYYTDCVLRTAQKNMIKFKDKFMRQQYGGRVNQEGDVYYFQFGAVAMSLAIFDEIPKAHYDVLRQYI